MPQPEAIIIGAGLSGLACATYLAEHGVTPLILESSDGVGGRVRTDELDGFLLDRGFQVLLTAYPAAQELLDYGDLKLRFFEPGALVWHQGRLHRISDPWRRPQHALGSLFSPVGTLLDKLRVARVRRRVCRGELADLFSRAQTSTADYLNHAGFSHQMIDRFFRPFLGGIFLENALSTSSRIFEFVFRMFAVGHATLPGHGIGAIPRQLAARLPEGAIRLSARVSAIQSGGVVLDSGETVGTRVIVVAVNGAEAGRLLGEENVTAGESVTCVYFDAPSPPVSEPILILNGSGDGPVNNLCVPSQIALDYAPAGHALISVSVLGNPPITDGNLVDAIKAQLSTWFGNHVEAWKHLRTYRIDHALPQQSADARPDSPKNPRLREGVYICGDHCETGSMQGALASGQRAANAILHDLADAGRS
jgi:phytoene dehydrogenase-like protein